MNRYQLGYGEQIINKGWQCPVCCTVMSPSFPTCFYCKPQNTYTTTTTTSTTSENEILKNE